MADGVAGGVLPSCADRAVNNELACSSEICQPSAGGVACFPLAAHSEIQEPREKSRKEPVREAMGGNLSLLTFL